MPLNIFPFRHRSHLPPVSSEDGTDESSPERGQPRVIHIPTSKNGHRYGERTVSTTDQRKMTRRGPRKMMEGTHLFPTLDQSHQSAHHDRQRQKPIKSRIFSASPDTSNSGTSTEPSQLSSKLSVIRRVASKLNISISTKSHDLHSRPSSRPLLSDPRPAPQLPRSSKVTPPFTPMLPNSFVGKEHREAALRERGLLPPHKDLSQQEREADERTACVPVPLVTAVNGSSEAERLKAKWLAMNSASESSDSDCGPQSMPESPMSSAFSDVDDPRRSYEGRADILSAGRPSLCSSVNAFSVSSHLEVLHEDPSEHGPVAPPIPLFSADLPTIVSSLNEGDFLGPHVIAENPLPCSFSSGLAVSGLVSDPKAHLDMPPPLSEKDNPRHSAYPASPRLTVDSGDRRRKVVGSTFSRFGTSSLSNLRRSVAGSLGSPSSSALSTTDIPSSTTSSYLAPQAPRRAVSPTIHSRGSILLGTKSILDAESRRLSELAFLD